MIFNQVPRAIAAVGVAAALVSTGAYNAQADRPAAASAKSVASLRVAADEVAIQELASRFENTFDEGRIDAHLATWVDDLTFISPFGTYRGKAAYEGWVRGFYDVAQASGGTRHLVTNFEIDVRGDTATMKAYLMIVIREPAVIDGVRFHPIAYSTAFTDDRLVRVNGQWKFVSRTLQVDEGPNP
jgi:ketosteroid isomerase-like protein